MMNLNDRPKTIGQKVAYYSICLLLISPMWFHSGIFSKVMTAVAAAIVVAVAGLVLRRRVICRG